MTLNIYEFDARELVVFLIQHATEEQVTDWAEAHLAGMNQTQLLLMAERVPSWATSQDRL